MLRVDVARAGQNRREEVASAPFLRGGGRPQSLQKQSLPLGAGGGLVISWAGKRTSQLLPAEEPSACSGPAPVPAPAGPIAVSLLHLPTHLLSGLERFLPPPRTPRPQKLTLAKSLLCL